MAINKIIDKINQETSAEVAAMMSEAQKKADANAAKIVAAARAKVKEIEDQAKLDADEVSRRQILIAELESRKAALNVQREVLEQAFTEAEKKLQQLPADQWEKLIAKLVLEGSQTGTEQLVVPAVDRQKYERGFLARLNRSLTAAGKPGKLTLSPEAAKFNGGVILEGADSDYDGSFPTLLKIFRSKYEHDVAEILFRAEVK